MTSVEYEAVPEPERQIHHHAEEARELALVEQQRLVAERVASQAMQETIPEQSHIIDDVLMHYFDKAKAFAEVTSAELIGVIRSNFAELSFENLRMLQTAVADIEENCRELHYQVKVARARRRDYLVCRLGSHGYIPLSAREETLALDATELGIQSYPQKLETVSPGQALDSVEKELSNFIQIRKAVTDTASLATRMGMMGGAAGTPPNSYKISVRSPSVGARVSYAPCYFLNYTVLASPTSPVHGYIAPGRYVFKVTTRAHVDHPDAGEFDIPPSGIASEIDLTV